MEVTMSKLQNILGQLCTSDKVMENFPSLRMLNSNSFSQYDELISRLEINENWKDSAVSNNLDIAAMRELSNFYYVVVQDGRYTDLLNSNPLAAADALDMKVSQEALDQLALMRQQLSSTAFNPAEVGNWGFALVVGIVVVGLIAIAV